NAIICMNSPEVRGSMLNPSKHHVADIAEAVQATSEGPLTPETSSAVRARLLHTLGVAVVGTGFQPFSSAVGALSPDSGSTPLLTRRQRFAPEGAAFANAVSAHSSLQEDCGPGGFEEGSHPGTYIIPAALAAAHAENVDGDRLLRG